MYLFNWINESLKIFSKLIKEFKDSNETNKTYKEFLIFYSYLYLYLFDKIFLERKDLKNELYDKFSNKIHPNIEELVTTFIESLFLYVEISLTDKDLFIIFDYSVEIMSKVKAMFSFIMDIDYYFLFGNQLENLTLFIEKSGLFNENIFYLLKVVPLIDLNENSLSTLLRLFIVVLEKFPNCFTDEVFELIILFLDKCEQFLDESVFYIIINAIINKYAYKGLNLVKLNNKFYKLIFDNEIYFNYFKKYIKNSIDLFLDLFLKNNGNILSFKDSYVEFIDKLELYKKYYEYIKNLDNSIENSNQIFNIIEGIFNNELFPKILLDLSKTFDDIVYYPS